MSELLTTDSLKALIRFPFEREDWQSRFAIGSVLFLLGYIIPVVPLIFVCGYTLQIVRQGVRGEKLSLPEWADWGKLGADGLRVSVATLVFLLPGLLILVGGFALFFGGMLASPWLAERAGHTQSLAPALLAVLLTLGSLVAPFVSLSVGTLLVLLGAIPLPVATAHLASRGELAAAFRVREWWPYLRANALGYLIAWAVVGGLWTIAGYLYTVACYSIALCLLVPLLAGPVGFYLSLIGTALFGQVYYEGALVLAERKEGMAG